MRSTARTNSSPTLAQTTTIATLSLLLKALKLPHIHTQWQALERQALQQGWTHAQF